MLAAGVRSGIRFNNFLVLIKLSAIAVFVVIAWSHTDPVNRQPFLQFGHSAIMEGTGLIFVAIARLMFVTLLSCCAENPVFLAGRHTSSPV